VALNVKLEVPAPGSGTVKVDADFSDRNGWSGINNDCLSVGTEVSCPNQDYLASCSGVVDWYGCNNNNQAWIKGSLESGGAEEGTHKNINSAGVALNVKLEVPAPGSGTVKVDADFSDRNGWSGINNNCLAEKKNETTIEKIRGAIKDATSPVAPKLRGSNE